MTITLITQEEHGRLLELQKLFPVLTFQNEGYQYIDKLKFTEEEKNAHVEISTILSKAVKGFREFNNFKISKAEEIVVRMQYNYSADDERAAFFTGVGYITVDELMNGFKTETP